MMRQNNKLQCLCVSCDTSYILLRLLSRYHNLMTAACTLQPEIGTNAQHFPLEAAARMLLLHLNNIADSDIHDSSSVTVLPSKAVAFDTGRKDFLSSGLTP